MDLFQDFPKKKSKKGKSSHLKVLPNNFFEDLLDLEFSLRRNFKFDILKEIVYMYSLAIEYYEARDDNRHRSYQNRLNNLLSQPEILKKMRGIQETNLEEEDCNERQKIKISVEYKELNNNESSNKTIVDDLVNDMKENMDTNKLLNIIMDDIKKQESSFKDKLSKRRKLKQNDISLSISKSEIKENKENNEHKEESNVEVSEEKENHDNSNIKEEDLNNKEPNEKSSSDMLKQSKFKILNEKIHLNLENYNKEYTSYFFTSLVERFCDGIYRLKNEHLKKYSETCRIYQNQIKEMEFLLNDEDQHADSLTEIVDSLKEEKQQELQRIEDHYKNLINEYVMNFKSYGLKNNSGIQLLEEKQKLVMFDLINENILTK